MTLQDIKNRLDTRLNNALCEMEPGYDDSVTGFNEAWDIMRELFTEEITKEQNKTTTTETTL